jgi:hypothetical protein
VKNAQVLLIWFILAMDTLGGGIPGGRLFELFIDLFSPQTTFARLAQQRQHQGPTPEQWTAHFVHHRQHFYNFLALAVGVSSIAFNQQLLLRTMVAESKGLSKRGREIFAQLGMLIPATTYRRQSQSQQGNDRDWSRILIFVSQTKY